MDSKLNNFVGIVGTIATLNIGIGFFILDKISIENPFFHLLTITLLAGLGLFGMAISIALLTYKPSTYYMTPKDPKRFIEDYANLTKAHIVRETAATMADITILNREANLQKIKRLNWVFWLVILGTIAVILFAVFTVLALGIPPPVDA